MHCDEAHHTADTDVVDEREGLKKGTGGKLEYFFIKKTGLYICSELRKSKLSYICTERDIYRRICWHISVDNHSGSKALLDHFVNLFDNAVLFPDVHLFTFCSVYF